MVQHFLRLLMVLVCACLLLVLLGWGASPRPEPAPDSPVVAVTGASGFLAGHVIQCLVDRGYTVRGSVRSLQAADKVAHLRTLFPTVSLYEADLLHEGSFDVMFRGCTYIIHTASPFKPQVPDPQQDLIEPALNGTLNVLRAAMRSGTVKRLVLTSSTAAIIPESPPMDADHIFSEADWNLESTVVSNPYRFSKRLAEEAAWKFAGEHPNRRLQLVALNPSFMLGPPLSSRVDATSIATIKGLLEGRYFHNGTLPVCFGAVDVRDAAVAHVLALQVPDAQGQRFLLSSLHSFTHMDFTRMLRNEYADWPLPTTQQPSTSQFCPLMDNTKAQKVLGLRFRPIDVAVHDMASKMVLLKLVHRPTWHQPPLEVRLRMALRRAFRRALGGGVAGMLAMVIQVISLMWLRTTMNYQYRHGHSTREVLVLLYREGGVGRFYQGLTPALIQGPLSRFCDTAANTGVLSLLDAFATTAALPVGVRTLLASAVAAAMRIMLMPVDALKTILQVEGRSGAVTLLRKVQDNGPAVLFAGALASIAAGFVGHYPWFTMYNWLNVVLPPSTGLRTGILRNAAIGVCATICSDSCSNALRVVKTQVQTAAVPITYTQVVQAIWKQEGPRGFFRGLRTRMLVNVLQGALFSVLWRLLTDALAGSG
eukprot:GGOE01015555.1.p1 GENE.GGOE01015555.1~~GGOE01015555.1.p1  ORF type:complete len:650 (-),score=219.86 GGOE01015555.1:8-1957(-)